MIHSLTRSPLLTRSPPSSRTAMLDIDGTPHPPVNVTARQDVLGYSLHRNAKPYLDSSAKVNVSAAQRDDLTSSLATAKRRRTSSSGEEQTGRSLVKLSALQSSHARASTNRMQSSNDKTEGPGVPHEPSMASSRLSYSPPSGAAASAQSIPHHPSATKSQSDDLALEHSGSQGSLLGPRLEIPTFTQSSSMMGSANAWGPRSAITTPVSAGSASSGSDRLPGIALLDQFLGSPWQGAITPVDEASGKPPALPALSIGPSITASGSQPSSQAPAILDGPSRLHTQDAYASSSSPSGFYPPPLDPRRQGMPSGQAGVSPITRGNMSPLWDAREPSSLDNTLFNQSNRQFTGAGRSDAGKQPAFDASPSMPFWPGSRSVVGTNQQQPQRQDYTQPEPPQLEHIQPQHLIDLQHQQQQQQRPSGMPAYPRAGGQSSAYDSPSSLKRKAPFTDSYYPGVPLPSLMQPQRSTSSSHYSDSDRRADLSSLENMRAEKAPEDWERRAMSGMAMSSTVPDVQVKAEPLPTGMGDFSGES